MAVWHLEKVLEVKRSYDWLCNHIHMIKFGKKCIMTTPNVYVCVYVCLSECACVRVYTGPCVTVPDHRGPCRTILYIWDHIYGNTQDQHGIY